MIDRMIFLEFIISFYDIENRKQKNTQQRLPNIFIIRSLGGHPAYRIGPVAPIME
jgi:hypothetical protein